MSSNKLENEQRRFQDMMRSLNVSCTCGVHDSGKFFFFSMLHCKPALSSLLRPSVLIFQAP